MKFTPETGIWNGALTEATLYIRNMSALVFLGLGGAAVVKYPEVAFPPSATVAIVLGILMTLVAIMMCVWLAVDAVVRLSKRIESRVILATLVFCTLLPTVCIVAAQIKVGMDALVRPHSAAAATHEAR